MRRRALVLCSCAALGFLLAPRHGHSDETSDAKWGPFRGQMIDADTDEPIPGAVAVAIWLEIVPTLMHTNHKFYDATVGVSGLDGTFQIPRRSTPFFASRIEKPAIEHFAPWYARIGIDKSEEGFTTVRMRKWGALSRQEQLHHGSMGQAIWIPDKERKALIDSINIERQRIGLRPVRSIRGIPW